MKQSFYPNLNTPYIGGWCEGFVEGCWGQATLPYRNENGEWVTSGVYDSATQAWVSQPIQHYDVPPLGISVPGYLSLGSTPDGHVFMFIGDGRVASSSLPGYNTQPFIYANLDELIADYAKYNDGANYLGWGEYVGKLKVVEEETMRPISKTELYYTYYNIYGIHTPDETLLSDGLLGLDYAFVNETVKDYANRNSIDYMSFRNKSEKQITDLQKEVTDLKNKPPQIVTKEVIVEKIVTKEVPIGFDSLSLGELLSEAFKKLFRIK